MGDININAKVNAYSEAGLVKRLINANFPDVCNLCFKKISIGETIFWYGKGFGSRCYKCYIKRDTLLTPAEFDELSDW